MNVKIRIGEKKDQNFIVNAQLAMALETENLQLDRETLNSGVSHLFDNSEIGGYLIAFLKEIPVASTLMLHEWSDWRNGNVIWIHSVYVLPEYRKMGIFRKIYQHIKHSVLNKPSLKGIRLYVEKENKRAQEVYSNVGMDGEHYQLYEWLPEG
jgi:GNAT superfamily N-acetyltransferase